MSDLLGREAELQMAPPLSNRSGQIHRGLGVVVRWAGVVMVIPSDTAHDGVVDQMLQALGPDPTTGSVVKSVNELLATEQLKAIALVAESPQTGLSAMVYGDVEVLADGVVALAGSNATRRQDLSPDVGTITLRASNLAKAAEPVAPYDLRLGIAPGAGLTLGQFDAVAAADPSSSPGPALSNPDAEPSADGPASDLAADRNPAAENPVVGETPQPANGAAVVEPAPSPTLGNNAAAVPVAEPVSEPPAEPRAPAQQPAAAATRGRVTHLGATSIPLVGPSVKAHDPLPPLPSAHEADSTVDVLSSDQSTEVEGIICARNHFNNPANATCMVCGLSLAHLSDERVRGPRPTLGFIVFDNGATFGLDRSYVIGREPQPSPQVAAEGLVVRSDNETLSRTHAELRLVGWQVQLVDRGSTNGTYIWHSLSEEWVQLTAEMPVELHSGATVALGRRTFVFEGVGG